MHYSDEYWLDDYIAACNRYKAQMADAGYTISYSTLMAKLTRRFTPIHEFKIGSDTYGAKLHLLGQAFSAIEKHEHAKNSSIWTPEGRRRLLQPCDEEIMQATFSWRQLGDYANIIRRRATSAAQRPPIWRKAAPALWRAIWVNLTVNSRNAGRALVMQQVQDGTAFAMMQRQRGAVGGRPSPRGPSPIGHPKAQLYWDKRPPEQPSGTLERFKKNYARAPGSSTRRQSQVPFRKSEVMRPSGKPGVTPTIPWADREKAFREQTKRQNQLLVQMQQAEDDEAKARILDEAMPSLNIAATAMGLPGSSQHDVHEAEVQEIPEEDAMRDATEDFEAYFQEIGIDDEDKQWAMNYVAGHVEQYGLENWARDSYNYHLCYNLSYEPSPNWTSTYSKDPSYQVEDCGSSFALVGPEVKHKPTDGSVIDLSTPLKQMYCIAVVHRDPKSPRTRAFVLTEPVFPANFDRAKLHIHSTRQASELGVGTNITPKCPFTKTKPHGPDVLYSLATQAEIPLSYDSGGIPQAEVMTMEEAQAEGLELHDFFTGCLYDQEAALTRIELALPTIMQTARGNQAPEHKVCNPEAMDALIAEVKRASKRSIAEGQTGNFVAECLATHLEPKAAEEADADHDAKYYGNHSDDESVESVRAPVNERDNGWSSSCFIKARVKVCNPQKKTQQACNNH
mmetsp:Transcript_3613/g.10656  ORF Transcript_3613/g.10656 Transcript_3613/m.10656 type:complete len:678 (+) Transcript_3613:1479-3512(+)